MATASMKDIRLRISSVRSTMQITKAMQLVASSKLRQARMRMENSRPYLRIAADTISDIANHNTGTKNELLCGREVKKRCIVVIAGDRGLAGSYNANVFKLIREKISDKPYCVLPVGRKACEYFRGTGAEVLSAACEKVEGMTMQQCMEIGTQILDGFKSKAFDEAVIAYTTFVSVLTQQARQQRLIPPEVSETKKGQMLFEPGPDTLLEHVMPDYLAGMLYSAVCDAFACEQAARRVAMDSASKNASEMIDDLNLRYNRARQASITQELTEIVAGAENENGED